MSQYDHTMRLLPPKEDLKMGKMSQQQINVDLFDEVKRLKEENEKLKAFRDYFDELYGDGLEVANWHLNGDLEL